jgi:predicted ribosome quality control (RQC) complex YloA/Tae2 family protein
MKFVDIDINNELFSYVVGENSFENFQLIDEANLNDLWFHANNLPSCHVVVKIENKNLEKKTIQKIITQGALLCKYNTNSLKSLNKIDFLCCNIGNLKKGKKEGSVYFINDKLLKFKKI